MRRLILTSPGLPNQRVELTGGRLPVVLGRGSAADLKITDELLSRRHSKISLDGHGQFQICDLDSTNLTIVNEQDVTSHVLRTGDRILLGNTEIAVEIIEAAGDFSEQTTRELNAVRPPDEEELSP